MTANPDPTPEPSAPGSPATPTTAASSASSGAWTTRRAAIASRRPGRPFDESGPGSIMRLVAAEVAGAIATGGHWYPKPIAERILVVIAEARDQAAAEARRDLLTALQTTADRAHRVGCRPINGLDFFNPDWTYCRNKECAAIRRLLDSDSPSPAKEPS